MKRSLAHSFHQVTGLAVIAGALAFTACSDSALPADPAPVFRPELAVLPVSADLGMILAQFRQATAPYHDVAAAVADGYTQAGNCEVLEGEEPIAIPFVKLEHILDGVIDPARPEALLYEPTQNGNLMLVGVELIIPFPLWSAPQPPEFFGVPFQREDGFGIFGLHLWIWQHNPDGLFAVRNPRVSCEIL